MKENSKVKLSDVALISVDWLQVCCYGAILSAGVRYGKYDVVDTAHGTGLFNRLFKIMDDGIPVATIQQEPRLSTLKQGLTLIKLENRVLWSSSYIAILYNLIRVFNLRYKGITRLDLCYDCNALHGGRSVSKFINDFVFKPHGTKGAIYRRGSEKFTCHGAKSQSSNSKITSIRFGSPNNPITSYCYDKTLELQEVKDKPWIRDAWEKAGLISNDKIHVWRFEISIKSEGQDLLNMDSGEIFRLSPLYMENYLPLKRLFYIYAKKVFDFRISPDGLLKKSNYKPLQIFNENVPCVTKPVKISQLHDTGRTEKICYNVLTKLENTYTDLASPIRKGISDTKQFLLLLSGAKIWETKVKKELEYLSNIRGHKFVGCIEKEWFNSINDLWYHKKMLHPDIEEAIKLSRRLEEDEIASLLSASTLDCINTRDEVSRYEIMSNLQIHELSVW